MPRQILLAALAVALAACDAGGPATTPPLALAAPAVMASAQTSDDDPFVVTESLQILAAGEAVVLVIEGQKFELNTRDAYRLGEALSSAGYAQDRQLQGVLARGGGDRPGGGRGPRCEPPPPGSYAVAFDGRLFARGGGDRCPPPPPPVFMEFDLARAFYGPNAEVVEVPGGGEWTETPAGFIGRF